jgi:general nucleoside transport system ATP-binding protein
MEGVWKRFGAVEALAGARLEVRAGEVHGVLGENGAGKTTLLSILGGALTADAGTISLEGRPVRFRTPREAWRQGIGLVHQHFALVPRFTVLENLALGHRRSRGGFALALHRVGARAAELADATGLEVPLERRVDELGVGDRQRAEILKVLLRDPRVVILDEPTAVLSPPEVGRLSSLLRHLARQGRAVLLVAHKLDEVLAVADRVTVLRSGRTVLEAPRSSVDTGILTEAMVGGVRAAPGTVAGPTRAVRHASRPGPVVARLDGVSLVGSRNETLLRDVTFEVRRGEIVGVAGVEGNGQREFARVLAGRLIPSRGRASLPADPAFIPQDRQREGLVSDFSLEENLALALHRDPRFRRGAWLDWTALRARTREMIDEYAIVAPGPRTRTGALSGGNQQRLVVARELGRATVLLIAENPTRGLDVAAASEVHQRLRDLRDAGASGPGIVLVSTDLDEILALADRVVVMVRGRVDAVPEGHLTRTGLGRLMLGGEGAT